MGKKLVLFDFNGTIMNDTDLWYLSACAVFEAFGIPLPSKEEVLAEVFKIRDGNMVPLWRHFGVMAPLVDIWPHYVGYENAHRHLYHAFPDVHPTLDELSGRDAVLGLISSHAFRAVYPQLIDTGLEHYFRRIYCDVGTKTEVIRRLQIELGIPPERVFFIGDHVADIEHAHQAGVRSVVMLRGHFSEAALRSLRPTYALKDMRELVSIVDMAH